MLVGVQALFWEERMSICAVYSQRSFEKIPMKIGKILSGILIVFMCCNMIVSIMALVRSDQRAHGVKATYSWQQTMDERFDDARLQRIYPNALKVE